MKRKLKRTAKRYILLHALQRTARTASVRQMLYAYGTMQGEANFLCEVKPAGGPQHLEYGPPVRHGPAGGMRPSQNPQRAGCQRSAGRTPTKTPPLG